MDISGSAASPAPVDATSAYPTVGGPPPADRTVRAEAVIDLGAVAANIAALRRRLGPRTELMAVVKADGYGHGMLPVAGAAVEGGAVAVGVATLDEGIEVANANLRFVSELERGKPTARFETVMRVLATLGIELEARVR